MYATSIGSVELSISNSGFGGDFELADSDDGVTSDLVVVADGTDDDPATQQRLYRLAFSNSRGTDAPYTDPDDSYHVDWGVGLPSHVDDLITPALENEVTAAFIYGFSSDPGVAPDPPPSVAFAQDEQGAWYVVPSYTSILGTTSTLPSIPLSSGG